MTTDHASQSRLPYRQPPKLNCKIQDLDELAGSERAQLQRVSDVFPFQANSYYLSLIDWNDPNDPIRRIIVPNPDEMAPWGSADPSNEQANTVAPGVQHKYGETAVILCADQCGGMCRYCFRKRLFMNNRSQVAHDVEAGLRYVEAHPEITNVLLTGGDPLSLPTRRLAAILRRLSSIQHVRIIRIGSKMPAFNPERILKDSELLQVLSNFSTPMRRIYLIAHFDHPRELTIKRWNASIV